MHAPTATLQHDFQLPRPAITVPGLLATLIGLLRLSGGIDSIDDSLLAGRIVLD